MSNNDYHYAIKRVGVHKFYLIRYLEKKYLSLYIDIMKNEKFEPDCTLYKDRKGNIRQTNSFAFRFQTVYGDNDEQLLADITCSFNMKYLVMITNEEFALGLLHAISIKDKKWALLHCNASQEFIRIICKSIIHDDMEVINT